MTKKRLIIELDEPVFGVLEQLQERARERNTKRTLQLRLGDYEPTTYRGIIQRAIIAHADSLGILVPDPALLETADTI